jgi:hypothetical protein
MAGGTPHNKETAHIGSPDEPGPIPFANGVGRMNMLLATVVPKPPGHIATATTVLLPGG